MSKCPMEITLTTTPDRKIRLEANLRLAIAYEWGPADPPMSESEMAKMLMLGGRSGIIKTLDELNVDGIRETLLEAQAKYRDDIRDAAGVVGS